MELWRQNRRMVIHFPIVMMLATGVAIGILPTAKITELYRYNGFDFSGTVAIGVGLPLTMIGLALLAYCYVMHRARKMIAAIETELSTIESRCSELAAGGLVHTRGVPSELVVFYTLLIAFAIPVTMIGLYAFVGLLALIAGLLVFFAVAIIRVYETIDPEETEEGA